MLLETENLGCGYDKKAVISDINLKIGNGELWCILGANGVGKSTLFKTLLGLINPIEGSVHYEGRNLSEWSRKELARTVSYVPQSHTPPFPFKVFEVVAMGRHPYQNGLGRLNDKDIKAVADALELLRIEHLSDKIYTQISGGERQLVLIARAIVQETPLMILDEPVSNLDFGNHAKVISYIKKLVDMGKSVIMTTHDPDHAFIAESNVLILNGGDDVRAGKGIDIVNESCIRKMYGVDSRILVDYEDDRRTCISLYG